MKNKKETQKKNIRENKSDYSSLDNELGKFNLEPPKHYREDSVVTQKKTATKKKNRPQTSQEKRAAQKKKRKRTKMFYKIVSIVAIVLAIVAVITTLSLTVFFKIDSISVEGNKKYTSKQIVSALPISKGQNLFVANTENAKEELEKELPYVFSADVKRKFPSKIIVNVTETPKVYSVKSDDETYTLLDENLKVLEIKASKRPKHCVAIKDAIIKNAKLGEIVEFDGKKTNENLIALTSLINELKLDEITAISSVDVNTNSIVYKGRITIKLGTLDKAENKIYSALTAIEKLNESDPNATGEMIATGDKQITFTEE